MLTGRRRYHPPYDRSGADAGFARARAGELESARPFGVIAEALECARPSADPRRSAIAALLSTRGSDGSPITVSSDPGLRFRAVDAITDLAEELAVDRPLVRARTSRP